MKQLLPNIFTLANLAAGLLALQSLVSGQYRSSAVLIAVALLCDFLDGLVARALKVHSELGKQLDSLADVVSFGVVPGFMLFAMFQEIPRTGEPLPVFLPYLAFLIPLFTALRLAKFNLDSRQAEFFIGLPSPANAILIYALGVWAFSTDNETTQNILFHPFLLTLLVLLSSLLLVAEIPLLSFKLQDLSWRNNKGRILLILGSFVLFILLRFRALAFVVPLYLLVSLLFKPRKP